MVAVREISQLHQVEQVLPVKVTLAVREQTAHLIQRVAVAAQAQQAAHPHQLAAQAELVLHHPLLALASPMQAAVGAAAAVVAAGQAGQAGQEAAVQAAQTLLALRGPLI